MKTAAIGIVLLISGAASLFAAEKRPPNVVFVFADDLGYGDLACYGHPYARTPNLDRLASEGTRFERFYVTGVTCCPSRTGIMTSRHPASFAKYMANYGFQGVPTVTEYFKKAGYVTGHFGKWHIGPETGNGTYGIDQIEVIGNTKDSPGGRDEGLFEQSMKFIEKNRDKPFYVNVWGHITHYPVQPPEVLYKKFEDIPFNRQDFKGRQIQKQFDDARRIGGDLKRGMRNYLADVWSLDHQVGRLLSKIKALGLEEHTLFVFSSDQGPAPVITQGKATDPALETNPSRNMLGYTGGWRGQKHDQHEGGVRVPFIVRWPGKVPEGKVNRVSVLSGMDWLPAVCTLCEVPFRSENIEGEDVSDIWLGSDRSRNKPMFWNQSSVNGEFSGLKFPWKIHMSRKGTELYNVQDDPAETNDLSGSHAERTEELTALVNAWRSTLPKEYIKPKKDKKKAKKDKRE
jgi:N-acetylgalactosamine-6-sulfatase